MKQIEIPMSLGNITYKCFVDISGFISDDELGFDTAFSVLKRGGDFQVVANGKGRLPNVV